RDEPQPKFLLTTRIVAPLYFELLNGCDGLAARSSSKRCCSRPSNVTARRNRAGMIRSVSRSLPRSGNPVPAIDLIAAICQLFSLALGPHPQRFTYDDASSRLASRREAAWPQAL